MHNTVTVTDNRLKVVVIGLGRIGFSYGAERGLEHSHVGAYLLHPEIDTVIGVDSDEGKLEAFWQWAGDNSRRLEEDGKTVEHYKDYAEAIAKEQPELASVCTPPSTHYEIMKDICHPIGPEVICLEKPVAESLEKANMIANRAAYVYGLTKESGAPKPRVAVNFSRRWHVNFALAKGMLESNAFGEPKLIVGHHPGPLLRSGIHMIDLFNWYLGKPLAARSLGLRDSWMTRKYPETDDYAYDAQIEYENSADAFLLSSTLADIGYQFFELEIYCTKGAIRLSDNGEIISDRRIIDRRPTYGFLSGLGEPTETKASKACEKTMLQRMVNDLVLCVKNKNRAPASNLEDGVQAQIIIQAVRQSRGQWIQLDSDAIKQNEVVKTV